MPLRMELFAALEDADRDADVRVIVLARGPVHAFLPAMTFRRRPAASRRPIIPQAGAGFWPAARR